MVGFRSVSLVTDSYSDQPGRSFYFRVNNVPIFLKGSNFIPIDSFESLVTRDIVKEIVDDAVVANMNVLRVWGGGIYQQDYFYDYADQVGILIWQVLN